jgi:hypothetical protein
MYVRRRTVKCEQIPAVKQLTTGDGEKENNVENLKSTSLAKSIIHSRESPEASDRKRAKAERIVCDCLFAIKDILLLPALKGRVRETPNQPLIFSEIFNGGVKWLKNGHSAFSDYGHIFTVKAL